MRERGSERVRIPGALLGKRTLHQGGREGERDERERDNDIGEVLRVGRPPSERRLEVVWCSGVMSCGHYRQRKQGWRWRGFKWSFHTGIEEVDG
jgi:hypothetical protein